MLEKSAKISSAVSHTKDRAQGAKAGQGGIADDEDHDDDFVEEFSYGALKTDDAALAHRWRQWCILG